ncbi:MAG: ABC transporter substrate-binding protein [Deltaproteobacteria bacterium]|nr:ABC transporter substrate-binding protein [Deltaproteobacteria bacterium]
MKIITNAVVSNLTLSKCVRKGGFVIPAKAGIQGLAEADWMPAPRFRGGRLCAGMTERGRISQQEKGKRWSGFPCLLTGARRPGGRVSGLASVIASLWLLASFAHARDMHIVYSSITASQSVAWVAQEAGMYQKHGIKPELVFVSSGSRAMSALISGETPLLFSAGSPAVSAALGGAKIKIVMGLLNVFPYYVVSSKGITQVEQLRGKRIGISRFGSSGHAAAVYALRKFNLEPGRDAALIQIGGGAERLAAMQSNAIQATLLTSPQQLLAKKLGYNVIADLGQLGIPFLHSAVITREEVIKQQPELLANFSRAVLEGIHFLKTKPQETLKIFRKYLRTDDMEALQDSYDEYIRQIGKVPYVDAKAMQTVLHTLGESQPAAQKAKPEQFVDHSVLQKIERSGFMEKLYGEKR